MNQQYQQRDEITLFLVKSDKQNAPVYNVNIRINGVEYEAGVWWRYRKDGSPVLDRNNNLLLGGTIKIKQQNQQQAPPQQQGYQPPPQQGYQPPPQQNYAPQASPPQQGYNQPPQQQGGQPNSPPPQAPPQQTPGPQQPYNV